MISVNSLTDFEAFFIYEIEERNNDNISIRLISYLSSSSG